MENKTLGIMLLFFCILLAFIIFAFDNSLSETKQGSCACTMEGEGYCPHEAGTPWQTYAGLALLGAVVALGVYIVFFDKSQKAILSTLERQRILKLEEEKFEILLKALSEEEKAVLKAVKEQDGITQQTLRYRSGLHKSKLSIVLEGLEKKDLIKRVPKGKTKQVFLNMDM